MAIYALDVAQTPKRAYITHAIYILCLIFSISVFFSDFIVAGAQNIGYATMAIKGNYYWVFQGYILFMISVIIAALLHGYKSTSTVIKIRSALSIIAFSPLVLVIVLVIALMALGYRVNASGLIPICTTIFLFIIIYFESKHKITDIRRFIPFSPERKLNRDMLKVVSLYSMDKIGYKEMLAEFEKLSIKYKYSQSGGNISETARRMMLRRTTLYSMIDRTDLKKILERNN